MLLSILIPTYNRDKFLEKNLYMLEEFITNNDLVDDVKIIVSNNNSQDNTKYILYNFSKRDKIKIDIYNQENNLGLERNVLFVLNKAKSEYVMTLGDDDYIHEKYLIRILDKIEKDKSIYCIIPSFLSVEPDSKNIIGGRDLKIESKIYIKGFNNCLKNSWRGHQISGLVFKKDGVLNSYKKNNVSSIYPQIYFVAYNCLRGKTWHLTDYPVEVTAAVQEDKDWGYEEDGLISEIFDNYKKLDIITVMQRSKLELKILNTQTFRYQQYLSKGLSQYLKALKNIEFGNNTSLLTRLGFPFLVFKYLSKSTLIKFLRLILGNKYEKTKDKLKKL